MSEETNVETNDGTWSGLKKTIIGAISTAILAGGTYFTTHLFGGSEDKEETKTEQSQPAAAPVVINLENNNTNQQKQQNIKFLYFFKIPYSVSLLQNNNFFQLTLLEKVTNLTR